MAAVFTNKYCSVEEMYTQEEVWIYAAIYFILCICSFIALVFIVMTFSMFYLMIIDHFFRHSVISEDKL